MHLEKRILDGKTKYYFAYSFRQGEKVRKIRIYLGADLSEKGLAEKRKIAEKVIAERIKALEAIQDPYQNVRSSKEMKELETLTARCDVKVIHLTEDDWQRFTEMFTYDTNAIEGSSVTEKEVGAILETGKWPERSKWEISETYGVAEAVAYVRKIKEHLSLELIKKLHELVFTNSKPYAGRFRKKGQEVVVVDAFRNVVHRGAPSSHVTSLLKELVQWYDDNRRRYHPIVLAAVVHNQFENVHPFADGNGRVGRLLLINILLRHGFPPLNIELKNRKDYYSALQAYQKRQDLRPTIELMLKEYRKLKRTLKG